MSWVVVAVGGAFTLGNTFMKKQQAKQAKKDQLADEQRAIEAEAYAETEGKGIGQLGKVSLAVDDDKDLLDDYSQSTVRI